MNRSPLHQHNLSHNFQDIDISNTGSLTYWDFYKGFKNKGWKFDQRVSSFLFLFAIHFWIPHITWNPFSTLFSLNDLNLKETFVRCLHFGTIEGCGEIGGSDGPQRHWQCQRQRLRKGLSIHKFIFLSWIMLLWIHSSDYHIIDHFCRWILNEEVLWNFTSHTFMSYDIKITHEKIRSLVLCLILQWKCPPVQTYGFRYLGSWIIRTRRLSGS